MDGNAYKIKATKPSGGAVIFLHGLGDSGEGWSMVSSLDSDWLAYQNLPLQLVKFRSSNNEWQHIDLT